MFEGLTISLLVVAAVVMLLRYLRQREVRAFLDADMVALKELRRSAGQTGPALESQSGSQQPVQDGNVVNLPTPGHLPDLNFIRRPAVLDDIHRAFYKVLQDVVKDRYSIFIHLPLKDIVKVDDKNAAVRLKGKTVSFVLVNKKNLSVICGIVLKGTSNTEAAAYQFLEEVFSSIELPLVSFPLLTSYSRLEVKQMLRSRLAA